MKTTRSRLPGTARFATCRAAPARLMKERDRWIAAIEARSSPSARHRQWCPQRSLGRVLLPEFPSVIRIPVLGQELAFGCCSRIHSPSVSDRICPRSYNWTCHRPRRKIRQALMNNTTSNSLSLPLSKLRQHMRTHLSTARHTERQPSGPSAE